ncbi:caspase family protein [Streptomyces sp. NPDC006458]|uniref:caspase family protein n=1 Tax=Streptomyces sp. NPDC006458 TaxID=3154302 RepID=UPI0033A304AE
MSPHVGGAAMGEEPRRFLIATAVARHSRCPAWDRPGLVQARERIIELFGRQLGYRHQSELGLDPTRAQLTDHLRAFCTAPDRREEDLLAVYISCHGDVLDHSGDHVLYTADTDPDDVAYTSLPTADLARVTLLGTGIRRLLLILDTCYSGQGGNELAAAALGRVSAGWSRSAGSGLMIISSAQPHQEAMAGLLPKLFTEAVGNWATAGQGPQALPVPTVVQAMNDHPDRPGHQRISLTMIGLTGEAPPFLANPRHSTRLTDVDLAVQQAAEFARRETELTSRLLVRAKAYHGDAAEGWWFCGRHSALADITAWLGRRATDRHSPPLVVTGGPGSGKSAVLGLVTALSHPERGRTVPREHLGLAPRLVPDKGCLDVAMYAQNLTDSEVLKGLTAAANVRAGTVDELLGALEARRDARPFTALIDALDEAATPETLCSTVLRPLIEKSRGRIRFLLGSRSHLLKDLGLEAAASPAHGGPVIDLDASLYADREALHAYTVRSLLDSHPTSPYRHDRTALRSVATAVADAAGTSFLVARITAGTLAAADHVADPHDRRWLAGLPRHAGQAMREDLTRRLGPDAQRAADLLLPLAFAAGQGLPWEDIWASLAGAVSGRVYTDEDLLWLRHKAGSYVVEATESGRSAYRLYHQALAEHLCEGTDPQAVHAAFTVTLTARVPYRTDGTRDWSLAHPYTLRHLPAHAAAAQRLDDVVTDPGFLVNADPDTLVPAMRSVRTAEAQAVASMYRASLEQHRRADPGARHHILARDAARHRLAGLHASLTERLPSNSWKPRWATAGAIPSGALLDTLIGHTSGVLAVACTTVDGRPVAVTGSYDRTVRIWDLETGQCLVDPLPSHTSWQCAVACTTVDGIPVAVVGGDREATRVWNLTNGRLLGELPTSARGMRTLACTTVDGRPVAVIGDGDGVTVWDLATSRPLGEPWPIPVHSPGSLACGVVDGRPVAVIGHDSVRVWNLTGDEPLPDFIRYYMGSAAPVACATVEGRPVAVAVDGGGERTLWVWDLATRRPLGGRLSGHTQAVYAVACTTVAGRPVAVTAGEDRTVRVWDLTTRRPIGDPLTGHTRRVVAVACTTVAGRPVAVTGSEDRTVRVWDLTTRRPMDEPSSGHAGPIRAVACTTFRGVPVAVSASDDGSVRVWDLATGQPRDEGVAGHAGTLCAMVCTTVDGRPVTVSAGEDGKVRVWDLATGGLRDEILPSYTGLRSKPVLACATVDGRPVAVIGSEREGLRVWDLAAHQPLLGSPVGSSIRAMACATVDGRPVAVTGNEQRTVHIWDLATGRRIGEPLTGHTGAVHAVACTTVNGRPVAVTGSEHRTVRVWDLATHRAIGEPLNAHAGAVRAITCTTVDGRPVAVTGGDDATVRVWDLEHHHCIAELTMPAPVFACTAGPDGELVVGTGSSVAMFSLDRSSFPR